MHEAEARIATQDASRYLKTIAEDWVHTYPVRYDAITGEAQLPGGLLIMTADGDSLTLRLTGNSDHDFEVTKAMVAGHVDRAAECNVGVRCVWHALS